MSRSLEKEIANFNKIHSNFNVMKINIAHKNESEYNESNGLLKNNNDDEDNQMYKVNDKKIKYMEDISKYRKEKLQNFYEQGLYIKKITDDILHITKDQDKKFETIDDNVENVVHNAKETYKTLLTTSKEEKSFKDNKCWIMLFVIVAFFFLILVVLNWL